jgi:ankyrin repeat protein
MVRLLLGRNADVNTAPGIWNSRTALQAASRWDHLEIVQLLLERNANVNYKEPGMLRGSNFGAISA